MKIASTIKNMCAERGLIVSEIASSAKMNENDDVIDVEVSFCLNYNHKVGEQAYSLEDLFSNVENLLSKFHPIVKITDADYEQIADKVLENGYKEKIKIYTSVEIKKPEGIFYFEINSMIWACDEIKSVMYNEDDDEIDTDFNHRTFYEFLEKVKSKAA